MAQQHPAAGGMLRLATATTFRPPCGAGAERIAELHSYDVPAAVIWPIERSLPAYAEWIVKEGGAA
ncbi:MAG: divalent-cation tolerance protein CutA [Pseudomonadota bacterium]|nr:divalent-cation tolerance protein CutA [Pseudomonadota bacterium]